MSLKSLQSPCSHWFSARNTSNNHNYIQQFIQPCSILFLHSPVDIWKSPAETLRQRLRRLCHRCRAVSTCGHLGPAETGPLAVTVAPHGCHGLPLRKCPDVQRQNAAISKAPCRMILGDQWRPSIVRSSFAPKTWNQPINQASKQAETEKPRNPINPTNSNSTKQLIVKLSPSVVRNSFFPCCYWRMVDPYRCDH